METYEIEYELGRIANALEVIAHHLEPNWYPTHIETSYVGVSNINGGFGRSIKQKVDPITGKPYYDPENPWE